MINNCPDMTSTSMSIKLLERLSTTKISEKYTSFNNYEIITLLNSKLIFFGMMNIYVVYLLSLLYSNGLGFFLCFFLIAALYIITQPFLNNSNLALSECRYLLILYVMIILTFNSFNEIIFLFLFFFLQRNSIQNLNQTLIQYISLYFIKAYFHPNQPFWKVTIELAPILYSMNQIFNFFYKKSIHTIKTFCKTIDVNLNSLSLHSINPLEQLIASIIHDLRNPVGTVHSILEIIINDDNISLVQKDQLETALFSCDFQLTIINNILDLAKIRASKFQLQINDFSLPRIIKMIVKMESNLARKKKLKYSVQILNTLPEIVKCDKNRISQIILNLIGNAIKFTEKGCIQIRVSWETNLNCIDFSEESLHKSIPGSGQYKHLPINSFNSSNSLVSHKSTLT